MSDAAANRNQQLVMYLLVAVVVLLAAIVVIIVWQNNQNVVPAVSQAPSQGMPTSNPGVGQSTGADFDPTTATKVPANMDPKKFVETYYNAILQKKWADAFAMQPAASQQGGTVEDFQATQEGYGMKAFKVIGVKAEGDESTVEIEQDLGANGSWGALWTFAKTDDGWVVKSRQVSMK